MTTKITNSTLIEWRGEKWDIEISQEVDASEVEKVKEIWKEFAKTGMGFLIDLVDPTEDHSTYTILSGPLKPGKEKDHWAMKVKAGEPGAQEQARFVKVEVPKEYGECVSDKQRVIFFTRNLFENTAKFFSTPTLPGFLQGPGLTWDNYCGMLHRAFEEANPEFACQRAEFIRYFASRSSVIPSEDRINKIRQFFEAQSPWYGQILSLFKKPKVPDLKEVSEALKAALPTLRNDLPAIQERISVLEHQCNDLKVPQGQKGVLIDEYNKLIPLIAPLTTLLETDLPKTLREPLQSASFKILREKAETVKETSDILRKVAEFHNNPLHSLHETVEVLDKAIGALNDRADELDLQEAWEVYKKNKTTDLESFRLELDRLSQLK